MIASIGLAIILAGFAVMWVASLLENTEWYATAEAVFLFVGVPLVTLGVGVLGYGLAFII